LSVSFSVVTPCLDQAAFLPEAIRSASQQTQPPIEHLVFDPGSSDGSRAIAADAPSVTLIAEPDTGQSDAVTRGFGAAKGDVVAWLNADDRYAHSRVFERVARLFDVADPPHVVYGRGRYITPDGDPRGDAFIFDDPSQLSWRLKTGVGLLQPAVFLHRRALDLVGGLDATLNYAMDYDFWIRLVQRGAEFAFLDEDLALAVVHSDSKTQSMRGDSIQEAIDVVRRHFGFVSWSWAMRQADWELTGRPGLTTYGGDPLDPGDSQVSDQEIEARAQRIFDGYNRNAKTVGRLLRPPWDRATIGTLSHLVRRAT